MTRPDSAPVGRPVPVLGDAYTINLGPLFVGRVERSPRISIRSARQGHELVLMSVGGAWGLLGIAAEAKADARSIRPLSHFAPGTIFDAGIVAAV